MASPTLAKIDAASVTPVRFANSLSQTVFRFRNRYQVYVIRHQTIEPYRNTEARTPLGHKSNVCLIILITEKRLLSAIASLRYVMRISRNHDSRQPCHTRILRLLPLPVKKLVWCPQIYLRFQYGVPRFPRFPRFPPDFPDFRFPCKISMVSPDL